MIALLTSPELPIYTVMVFAGLTALALTLVPKGKRYG